MPVAGFTIIPRSPTEVYFDVSTEALETQLYNQIYCCDTANDPTCAAGCAPGKPFATPSTWADILNREALRVSRLMFSLRPEGHMFHQVRRLSSCAPMLVRPVCVLEAAQCISHMRCCLPWCSLSELARQPRLQWHPAARHLLQRVAHISPALLRRPTAARRRAPRARPPAACCGSGSPRWWAPTAPRSPGRSSP